MNRVEVESFLKSFLLFFISLGILISVLFYLSFTKELDGLERELFSQMRVCSFDLKCEQFEIDFIEKDNQEFYELYKKNGGLQAYFPISQADTFIMELKYPKKDYEKELNDLKFDFLLEYLGVMLVVFVLSVLFSIYALSPLKNALLLTQEFIKDILHDFNTPLASLRLNSSMLHKDEKNRTKIMRIEQAVENVLDLQENLRSYLHNHEMQKELFDMRELVLQRVNIIEKNYPNLEFKVDMESTHVQINKEAMKRIIDNILSNAAKYNKKDGYVYIKYDTNKECLEIQDSGIGIKNPARIFQRFYKENERGIGIGLHIVKKLCDELNIDIRVESKVGVGTIFTLTLR